MPSRSELANARKEDRLQRNPYYHMALARIDDAQGQPAEAGVREAARGMVRDYFSRGSGYSDASMRKAADAAASAADTAQDELSREANRLFAKTMRHCAAHDAPRLDRGKTAVQR